MLSLPDSLRLLLLSAYRDLPRYELAVVIVVAGDRGLLIAGDSGGGGGKGGGVYSTVTGD